MSVSWWIRKICNTKTILNAMTWVSGSITALRNANFVWKRTPEGLNELLQLVEVQAVKRSEQAIYTP